MNPEAHYIENKLSEVFHDSLGVILCSIAAMLAFRIAAAKERSRYLRHLGIFFSLMGLGKLIPLAGKIVGHFIAVGALTSRVLDPKITLDEARNQAIAALAKLEGYLNFTELMWSFFTTFWLYIAWRVLLRYPKLGISHKELTVPLGVLTTIIGFVRSVGSLYQGAADSASALDVLKAGGIYIVEGLDTVLSSAVLVLFGWALINAKREAAQRCGIMVRYSTMAAFVAWAALQFGYWVFKNYPGTISLGLFATTASAYYAVTLQLCGFIAMILSIVTAVFTLEDKPLFHVDSTETKAI